MREKKELHIKIGEQIKFAREQAKLTQELLAEQVGVSPQYVSDLERGVVGVSIATLIKICTTLGVTSDQILFGNRDSNYCTVIHEKLHGLSESQISASIKIVDSIGALFPKEND